MSTHLVTTKITPEALALLRLISKETGEKQFAILARLLRADAKRKGLQAEK